jgi:oligoendopeptidase F
MLDHYRREYADFNAAWMREYYLYLSGQKADLEIARIHDRYSDLFTREAIDELKQRLEESSSYFDEDRAAIQRLLAFAINQFLENSASSLTEAVSQYESRAIIEYMDRRMTFHDSVIAITRESDGDARRALYKKRLSVLEASNDLRAERLSKLHETARWLGYESYTSLYQVLHEIDYGTLAREVDSLLARTETLYTARLDEALKRGLGIGVAEAERSDIMYFLHLAGYDELFPADSLLRVYRDTMAGLNIVVEAQQNISIDSEPRPNKSPRAFCAPILIPDEIKLVIRPAGGQSDYMAFFHEGGHAQHYGWASKDLRPEFKYTGDPALTETYAFLFNHLLVEGAWLTDFLRFADNGDFVRSAVLTKLLAVRRYAAKLKYELELHTNGNVQSADTLYAELLIDATKFKNYGAEYLFDLDDAFYSAGYLRAWAFEVALREHLKTRFGQRWWTSPRAGSFLKEVWETGDRYTADQMAAQIGIGPITFDLLIDEFNQALK